MCRPKKQYPASIIPTTLHRARMFNNPEIEQRHTSTAEICIDFLTVCIFLLAFKAWLLTMLYHLYN